MARLAAPWPGAVAVSGGADSLALMHLLRRWAKAARRTPPVVLTVDHGLREGSAADARKVLRWAKAEGLKAHVLRWTGAKPEADLEAEARAARYRLMGEWCARRGIEALYVAHTRDDQAETFLLRLARGSGLDGLAAMRAMAPCPGKAEVRVVRPLLDFARPKVREGLEDWIEDPMNADPRFGRVRIREAMALLGIPAARIAGAVAHLGRAREALDEVTAAVLRRACARGEGGAVLVDAPALAAAPREIGLRALAQLLRAVSGQPYRPRFERLERLFDLLAQGRLGGGCTLHGCKIASAPARQARFGAGTITISPETGRKPAKRGAIGS
ncbi:MAG TPA: tRNA lysidine(34) synthetase TilS [Rhizomicrobium sp.]|nr:tRNA lysidine(34) synthetase TilS [Rhizomicrobium sp.]